MAVTNIRARLEEILEKLWTAMKSRGEVYDAIVGVSIAGSVEAVGYLFWCRSGGMSCYVSLLGVAALVIR